jgi:hypothetical protein
MSFLFIGIAVGILTDQVIVGVMAGSGLSFVAMAILRHMKLIFSVSTSYNHIREGNAEDISTFF